ncbi:MAG: metallophosphoesterase [Verrucomicrobia bacterium]|nr:metallophosphoesterase [Verrucomicrobiota bacterium]
MRILFTADLHLVPGTHERVRLKVREWIALYEPEVLVVAGDLSTAPDGERTLRDLRHLFPDGRIAVCMGNHDFWLPDLVRGECRSLSEVIERFWEPAARKFDVTLLDSENVCLPGLAIVGGYGHYDLGFAIPGLSYDGIPVTEADYKRGWVGSKPTLRWRDCELMPGNSHPGQVATEQVAGVQRRLAAVEDRRVIVVLHTPPFEALLGVPPIDSHVLRGPPSVYAFFRAYLGNRSMGEFLEKEQGKVAAVLCGHTHRQAGPLTLTGLRALGINVGSDYGAPRAVLFESELNQFERVPD